MPSTCPSTHGSMPISHGVRLAIPRTYTSLSRGSSTSASTKHSGMTVLLSNWPAPTSSAASARKQPSIATSAKSILTSVSTPAISNSPCATTSTSPHRSTRVLVLVMIQKDDLNNTTCFFGAVAGLEPTLPLFLFCYVSLQVHNNSCNFAAANL